MTNDKVLEIRNLTKKYKDKVVFSEINLDFYRKKYTPWWATTARANLRL